MKSAVTDTHSLIWYLEDSPRLGIAAGHLFDACSRGESIIYIPTICLVEMAYLHEKGRIPGDWKALIDELLLEGGGFVVADLTYSVVEALTQVPRTLVPDMPDRIIVATALSLKVPLISRDQAFQRIGGLEVVW